MFVSAGRSLTEILYSNRTIFSREWFWQDIAWASECISRQGDRKGHPIGVKLRDWGGIPVGAGEGMWWGRGC